MENCTDWAGRIDRPEVRTRERERERGEKERERAWTVHNRRWCVVGGGVKDIRGEEWDPGEIGGGQPRFLLLDPLDRWHERLRLARARSKCTALASCPLYFRVFSLVMLAAALLVTTVVIFIKYFWVASCCARFPFSTVPVSIRGSAVPFHPCNSNDTSQIPVEWFVNICFKNEFKISGKERKDIV